MTFFTWNCSKTLPFQWFYTISDRCFTIRRHYQLHFYLSIFAPQKNLVYFLAFNAFCFSGGESNTDQQFWKVIKTEWGQLVSASCSHSRYVKNGYCSMNPPQFFWKVTKNLNCSKCTIHLCMFRKQVRTDLLLNFF